MLGEREHAGAPAGFTHAARAAGDLFVPCVHAVEESDREGEAGARIATHLVMIFTRTLARASRAAVRLAHADHARAITSRTKTCFEAGPAHRTAGRRESPADPRRSSTIVGNGITLSGATTAAPGSAAICSIVNASRSSNGPEASRTSAPMCAGTPIAAPRSSQRRAHVRAFTAGYAQPRDRRALVRSENLERCDLDGARFAHDAFARARNSYRRRPS